MVFARCSSLYVCKSPFNSSPTYFRYALCPFLSLLLSCTVSSVLSFLVSEVVPLPVLDVFVFPMIRLEGPNVREIPALVRLNKRTVSFSFQQFFISFSIIYCLHFTVSNNSELSYQLIHELRFYKFIFSNTMVDYFDTYVNQITL